MSLRWYSVVVDCHDVAAQARWWAQTLDYVIVFEDDDEAAIVPRWAQVEPIADAETFRTQPQGLVFVPVPEGKTVKNRLHIDLAPHSSEDRDAEIQSLLDRGATLVDVGQDDSATWTVLADPEGNEFCVLSARQL
ncbi:MAG TPA: VOC family protein [Intrasporangiaceae bacterium]|nr:VOC family protein [Intrasporangiaceae bacterium]